MSIVIQKPKPKSRNKKDKKNKKGSVKELIQQESHEEDHEKVLAELRQSIEKVDQSNVTENNLYNPNQEEDKMEKPRRPRRDRSARRDFKLENEVNGFENDAFEEEKERPVPPLAIEDNLEEANTSQQRQNKPPRRRRREKENVVVEETKNEELSGLPMPDQSVAEAAVQQQQQEEPQQDEGPPEDKAIAKRRRRRQKKPEESAVHREAIEMHDNEAMNVQHEFDPLQIVDEGRVLSVMVHRTDRLKTDLCVLHPMIRVSVVDSTTGTLIAKQHRDRRVVSCNEDTERIPFVMPVMTRPYEFKFNRGTIPAWEETLIFSENANYFTDNPNVVFFFEVVDMTSAYDLSRAGPSSTSGSGLRQVSWAFLRPLGAGGARNTDRRVRLQLYECGARQPSFMGGDHTAMMPDVVNWWRAGLRHHYPSTLYVTLSGIRVAAPSGATGTSGATAVMRSMFPHQMEGDPAYQPYLGGAGEGKSGGGNRNRSQQLSHSALSRWARLPGQSCHIPDTPLFSLGLGTGGEGCSTLAFSPDGRFLAAGTLQSADAQFPVLIYDMFLGEQTASSQLTGHNRIVHCMAWCPHSVWLASGSADGTCRLWRVGTSSKVLAPSTSEVNPNGDADTTTTVQAPVAPQNPERKVLSHPCFLYSVQFHPQNADLLVTAGFDRIIRFWDVTGARKEVLQQLDGHRGHINSLTFCPDGVQLYSGDSQGEVRVWACASPEAGTRFGHKTAWSLTEVVRDADIAGIVINHLAMAPTGKRIFVHTRDGSVRLLDLKIKTMVLRFLGISNTEKNIRCCVSPCGSFLFSGSEDSFDGMQEVCVWNAQTGDQVANYKKVTLPGPVCTIDYHPKCHLIAFSAVGNNSTIMIYGYNYTGSTIPEVSPVGSPRHLSLGGGSITRLEESPPSLLMGTSSAFGGDTMDAGRGNSSVDFLTFQRDYERRKMDRMSRVLNSLSSVTEADRILRRGANSLDRDRGQLRTVRYENHNTYKSQAGPEEKGNTMRSLTKPHGAPDPVPMTLSAVSPRKANFTFKPPPSASSRNRGNQPIKYLGEVVALYDYQAQRSDELSFARGEVIRVVFRDGPNWLLGETSDGTQGYFPSNYVAGADLTPSAEVSLLEEKTPSKPSINKIRLSNSVQFVDGDVTSPTAERGSSRQCKKRDQQNNLQKDQLNNLQKDQQNNYEVDAQALKPNLSSFQKQQPPPSSHRPTSPNKVGTDNHQPNTMETTIGPAGEVAVTPRRPRRRTKVTDPDRE